MRRHIEWWMVFVAALMFCALSANFVHADRETVVYPVRPMEERNVDSLVDKARRAIYTQFRALAQEERIERANNDAVDGDYEVAYEDSEYAGEDSDSGIVAEPAGADDYSGGMEEAEGYDGGDTADPVLTEWQYYGNCRITHYDAGPCCCGEWATGCTASGVLATTHHTVASGPDLPFGTEVLINGEVYVVEDRGVDEYQIDIFVDTHEEALAMGMYYTDVYVRY